MAETSPDTDQQTPNQQNSDEISDENDKTSLKNKKNTNENNGKKGKKKDKIKKKSIKIGNVSQAKKLLKSLKDNNVDVNEKYEIAKSLKSFILSNNFKNENERRMISHEFLSIHKIKNENILSVLIVFITEIVKLLSKYYIYIQYIIFL